ncbi:hypothetical protein ES703_88376 [subsurface metagenome]
MLGKLPCFWAKLWRDNNHFIIKTNLIGLSIKQGYLLQTHFLLPAQKIYTQAAPGPVQVNIGQYIKTILNPGPALNLRLFLNPVAPTYQRFYQLLSCLKPKRLACLSWLHRLLG